MIVVVDRSLKYSRQVVAVLQGYEMRTQHCTRKQQTEAGGTTD